MLALWGPSGPGDVPPARPSCGLPHLRAQYLTGSGSLWTSQATDLPALVGNTLQRAQRFTHREINVPLRDSPRDERGQQWESRGQGGGRRTEGPERRAGHCPRTCPVWICPGADRPALALRSLCSCPLQTRASPVSQRTCGPGLRMTSETRKVTPSGSESPQSRRPSPGGQAQAVGMLPMVLATRQTPGAKVLEHCARGKAGNRSHAAACAPPDPHSKGLGLGDVCVLYKLLGDSEADGPWTTPEISGSCSEPTAAAGEELQDPWALCSSSPGLIPLSKAHTGLSTPRSSQERISRNQRPWGHP